MVQVERLLSEYKVLNSNPRTTERGGGEGGERKRERERERERERD
jgi:hypothetical protein